MTSRFEAHTFPLEPGLRLLEASAGTGKTFSLAHLVLRYVSEAEVPLRQLLVVTFTNAAAAELRDRIGQRLQTALGHLDRGEAAVETGNPVDPSLEAWLQWARPRAALLRAPLLLALEDLDGADITTIHGFCLRTLQRQALEAGQPPELQLDSDAAPLVRQVCHDYWRQQVLALPPHLLDGVQRLVKGPEALVDVLQTLDGDPALAVDPLPDGMEADQPLAPQLESLWQSRWDRFQLLWQQHGEALEAELRAAAGHWRDLGASKTTPYSPKPRKDRCQALSQWIQHQGSKGDYAATLEQKELKEYFHPGAFLKVARPIEATASGPAAREPSLPQRPLLEAVADLREGPAEAVLLHAAHWGRRELAHRRERQGRMGYGQLLESLDPGDDPEAPCPLLDAVGERYSAVLVDEFQDTDPIQWRILSRAFDARRHRLVLVGDPKQAIYRFRGGELATYRLAYRQAAADGGISRLDTNYRATPSLIAGLNALMAPGLPRSGLAVPPVQPPPSPSGWSAPGGEGGDAPTLSLLWLGSDRPAGEAPPTTSAVEQELPDRVARLVAAEIRTGEAPADLCLLVSTHRQAGQLRVALARAGIASRLVSDGDVFASDGATALQRLLDGLAHPGDPRRLRLLAASPLLGWSAGAIAAAGAEQWSALSEKLLRGRDGLPRLGLLGVLAALLDDEGLARLGLEGRVLADLNQCALLLQERIHTDQLGADAAAEWLRQRRLAPDPSPPESHQPNSDVEDEAVWVVTVHRSKGLEYPVVICPYLWKAPHANPRGLGLRWQPSDRTGPVLDLHLGSRWGRGHQALEQHRAAELQEAERRAYVACTRAKRRLLLAWGPVKGQAGNPLHPWLLAAQAALADADDDPYATQGDGELRQALELGLAARQVPMVLMTVPPAAGPLPGRPPATATEPLTLGPVPQRRLDHSWGRSSYTSWTRGSHAAAPQALEEGRETDALAREPELAAVDQEPWPGESPLADIPRGSRAGDCLHRILESLDYQRPATQQSEAVRRELERSGIGRDHLEDVLSGVERLRLSPMGGPLGDFRLAGLERGSRINEMNFDLTLGPVTSDSLARPFRDHPGGSFGAGYADQLAALSVQGRGFLTGSIDLVFCHQGRWWVADWKSNWLGERGADGQPLHCGPRHYGAAALAALMAANHYPLQAHLYLVALHRYLRWRLRGYDPARHLGGYAYVFLRGLAEPSEALRQRAGEGAVLPGLAVECPPLERLLALDRALNPALARSRETAA
ncbi:exodeoxyribonuclease V, beta subunit [Cyanobium sp. PCC 7001]|uniref:UvrD-helicase domain-containing protein n=1 Tax=Cyanobium sp. PCC 7001 TaxID=180281 RepID=UPI0001804EFB|nr:UvrD-helicase domain-containing protein [Cyanobium sp. PCC 7001]EDY39671.1 exodeoxyribonuclease V, beta subunit [Cyanobium sp. PCC 7001]